jgi:excisionase family DNA binding protein
VSARLEAALAELAEAIREEVRAEVEAGPRAPDRLLSIDEAATMLGIGRSKVYAEIAAGRLRSCKAGRRRLVPASAIQSYIAERSL